MNLQLSQFNNLTFKYLSIQPYGSFYKVLGCNSKLENNIQIQNNCLLVTQKNELRKFKTVDSAYKVAKQILKNCTVEDDFIRIHK